MDNEKQSTVYDLKSVKMPYLTGTALRIFGNLVEGPLKSLLAPTLLKNAGITWFRKQNVDDIPQMYPLYSSENASKNEATVPHKELPNSKTALPEGFQPATVLDYAEAYRSGKITPVDVAERLLTAVENSELESPALRAFIAMNHDDVLRQAQESTKRIKAGKAWSVFDGVPVAVKDEVDMTPFPTSAGTAFLGKSPAKEDSTVVARMRIAGALLIGKTNMHEIGIGVTGLNPIHGTPRNPYNPGHFSGGSSSGSGVAVAAGFCPVAIGADGGGSIRIPAAFCGIVGLKPTFGRISEHGAFPLCWSVAHLGPIAATVTDTALGYAVMAGPDRKDPKSLHQPAPSLLGWNDTQFKNFTLGIYRPWIQHATTEITKACGTMLEQFEAMGAKIKEITIPDLELARIAHTISIAGEMAQSLSATYNNHHKEHGLDVRINLALARSFTTLDYLKAQKVRSRMIAHFNKVFQTVDVILTPSTGVVAPPINPKALSCGESDLTTLFEIMRFAPIANLTGLPAISFPAGYNSEGLPVGMQAIGNAWQEATLLKIAYAAERIVPRRKPQIHYSFLPIKG